MTRALSRLGWKLLGALGACGPVAPGLTVALVIVGLPGPKPSAAPVPLNAQAAQVRTPVADPETAHIEQILDAKAPGLGLEVRAQLARAVVEESKRARLDPLMVLAVMRVESEFDEDALSVAGARGLMQLRPGTLAFLAHRAGLKLPTDEIMADPVLSTRMAIRYLGRLTKSFHGDLDHALMAYNAGPHRMHVAVRARDSASLDHLSFYPRRVRRAYLRLRAMPPADPSALAENTVGLRAE